MLFSASSKPLIICLILFQLYSGDTGHVSSYFSESLLHLFVLNQNFYIIFFHLHTSWLCKRTTYQVNKGCKYASLFSCYCIVEHFGKVL